MKNLRQTCRGVSGSLVIRITELEGTTISLLETLVTGRQGGLSITALDVLGLITEEA